MANKRQYMENSKLLAIAADFFLTKSKKYVILN